MMTNRERLLSIMSGQAPDRIPWIPRLLLWYNAHERAGTLPEQYRGWTLREIERDLGLGTPARDGQIMRTELSGVEIRNRQISPMEILTEYITPVGTVSTLFRGSELLRAQGIQDMQVEFMLKSSEDYPAVEYIIEHTDYTATYADYEAYERKIGDDGYPMISAGDCPFHQWLKSLVGYNNGYYHLADYPDEVESLLGVMERRDREVVWPLIADSPARLILHGVHFSSQMTPPRIFDRFIMPYYQEFSDLLHSRGKTLTMHGDNDTRAILYHLERAGYDMVECFVTHPMVKTTLAEARATWGNRVIIWGGVPAIVLEESFSDQEFELYMENLFRTIAPGDAFILGVADNVMPTSKLERVRRITQMAKDWGTYPIRF
jgi:hypothetical protein